MKLELRVAESDSDQPKSAEEKGLQCYSQDASIDIAQVLAANQALLKNISRKMEELDTKIRSLETNIDRQYKCLEGAVSQKVYLLAPPREIKPWTPEIPPLNRDYFSQFSLFDRIFRPYKLRRPNSEA